MRGKKLFLSELAQTKAHRSKAHWVYRHKETAGMTGRGSHVLGLDSEEPSLWQGLD